MRSRSACCRSASSCFWRSRNSFAFLAEPTVAGTEDEDGAAEMPEAEEDEEGRYGAAPAPALSRPMTAGAVARSPLINFVMVRLSATAGSVEAGTAADEDEDEEDDDEDEDLDQSEDDFLSVSSSAAAGGGGGFRNSSTPRAMAAAASALAAAGSHSTA